MWVDGQRHALAAFPPGKTRYPICRRLDGPQGRSGRVRKISPPTGIRSPDRPVRSESLYRLSYPGPQSTLLGSKTNICCVTPDSPNVTIPIKYIIINIKEWTLWSVPSPELQLLAPTLLRSSNCSPGKRWHPCVKIYQQKLQWVGAHCMVHS